MRLGVLDVGSNTVHLLVVDAHRGGHPTPMSSTKSTLRLSESLDSSGKITKRGAEKLISTIDEFAKIADSSGCEELMAFATSAVRDAENSDDGTGERRHHGHAGPATATVERQRGTQGDGERGPTADGPEERPSPFTGGRHPH